MRYEVLVDRAEPANKCSILPLAGRDDLALRRFDRRGPIEALTGNLLLHPDGEDIRAWASAGGLEPGEEVVISAVDCHWRRLAGVVARIAGPLPPLVRLPDGLVSAYPRRNQQGLDPAEGLATVEALFAAAALLGHRDESLLALYTPAGRFLDANARILAAGPAHPPLVKPGGAV